MRQVFATAAFAATLFSTSALAAQATCGPNNKCPSETPCCSQYGQCGVGAYCLGGCDPLFSHSLTSCVPSATCKSQDYKLNSLNDVQSIDKYLGDYSGVNWVSSGKPLIYEDSLLLTMAEGTVGTLLGSTHYVWYGKICAKMTSSQGAGVVTAFIMMSDVKDEIDFEFVGTDVQNAQTNYYSQGVTVYTNGRNVSASNTESTMHEYCIDWKQDELTWAVDGTTLRTVKRSDTWNSTSGRFDYPQTPSRVMLSLWPAGLPTNAKGTIDWAGGEISWNSPYMQNGYYYAMVKEVTVDCYDPPTGASVQGSKSYVYTNEAGTNNTVQISDKTQILGSFYATGENEKYDPNAVVKSSASSTGTAPAQSTTAEVETVPGMSGAGNQAAENNNAQASSSAAGSQATDGSVSGTQSASSSSGTGGFSQNNGGSGSSNNNNSNGATEMKGKALGSSIFAVWVGVLGLLIL